MKKSLISLAFGTLGLGIAEFVMMGILPDVARDLKIGIPQAGHFISMYALGVAAGAPLLVFTRNYPPKKILLALISIMIIGNIGATLAPGYVSLLIARFISGLPHGAYFGVASIVAEKLADKGKGAEAVSIMIAGITIANLLGVPLGTSFSTMLSWRTTFLLVSVWGLITLYYTWRWIPCMEASKSTNMKSQFGFLKHPAPWLVLFATALGNGGILCWYSYISTLLTGVSGFSAESVTGLIALSGLGMVAGNMVSGRMADRHTPGKVGAFVQGMVCITLFLIFYLSPYPLFAAILTTICAGCLFAISGPEQVMIIRVSPGGEMLGAACVQVAFNIGNAFGAYLGGLVVDIDLRYPALLGIPFAFAGFVLLCIFYKIYEPLLKP